MKKLILLAGVAALAGCMTPMDEPLAEPSDAVPMGLPALAYVENAASGDLFEIESSRMALSMSRNPAVRNFAQMLIDHHTRLTNETAAAARADGLVPPPPRLLPQHQAALQRLQSAGMNGFESAFKAEQITAHQEALNLHSSYARDGDRPALRNSASRAVPIVQSHLDQAQNLPDAMMAPPQQPMMEQPVPRAGERG
jgi:putative membrane protein